MNAKLYGNTNSKLFTVNNQMNKKLRIKNDYVLKNNSPLRSQKKKVLDKNVLNYK